ncbi:MAG: DUF3078 domain-containing protein [Bacteroidetes bacterium]|nr:DUF3078 domain-containing protein [Bacteroidota bacterium]
MKRIFLAGLCLVHAGTSMAQLPNADKLQKAFSYDDKDTVAWLHSGVTKLGINQGYLHNWAAGGELVSLAIDGLFSARLTRLYHRQVWSNSLDASYSLFYAYSNHFVPRKVDDRIDLTSKYGVRVHDKRKLYLMGLFNFKSQFTPGYDYGLPDWPSQPTSSFLSPGYFTLAAGMEYRGGNNFTVFLSPVALRLILADKKYTSRMPAGAFGIDYGKTSRLELGAYFTARYETKLSNNLSWKTQLDLYSNYLAKDKKDSLGNVVVHDNPGNIDVFWDNLISYKLSKFFSLNFALTATYDNDIPYNKQYLDPTSGTMMEKDEPDAGLGWWQIKEVMSFGFSYNF